VVLGGEEQMSIDCEFGTLGVTDQAGGIIIRVFADTDRTDCGTLVNNVEASGSNLGEPLTADASIDVKCPTITLEKENDAVGSVLPGTTVTYTLTLTVSDGPANDVMVVDEMPEGLEDPTDISDGGSFDEATNTITWDLGDLNDGIYELTYNAVVADDVEHGEELVNAAAATSTNSQCPDLETLGPECEDGSTVIVRVPTLVIDKVANAEVIVISGPNDALVATPSVVTWTLTYTLTNGPVTNAVITDEVPVGFEFLDASDGGLLVDGVVTWTFPTLTESGSVSFRTTVDPETISRVAPTVNVAVIDSDETAPDEGEDSVTVEVEPPVSGGNPTPPLPDTAAGVGLNGEPITVPVELMVAFFLGSLGALALANARSRSRRR
jgi:fimbrial isopeptide formation D2 family protein